MSELKKRILFTAKPALKVTRFTAPAAPDADEGEEKITLSGYAIIWNSLSDDRGGFHVRFLPGSAQFATPTLALFHHDYTIILGNTANGTLRITPDATGVRVEMDLPATTAAADVAELVEDAYVSGMSFSMLWDDVLVTTEKTENGVDILEVSAFTCDEVTVTGIPSFVDTSVVVKSDDAPAAPATLSRASIRAPDRIAQALQLEKLALGMKFLDV